MAVWNPPIDALLLAGKPGRPSHARAIRDLTSALAERAAGAPWVNGQGVLLYSSRGFGAIVGSPPEIAGERRLIGTWVVPDDVYRAHVTMVGGGGAGGRGSVIAGSAGGGGGGGAGAVEIVVIEVIPGEVHSMIIGAGGAPDFIHPDVDTSLDSFILGDGARTTFGVYAAAGGKEGGDAGAVTTGGLGGAGGNLLDGRVPDPSPGGHGGSSLQVDTFAAGEIRSGSGGMSYLGGGAPGRFDTGVGYDAGGVVANESWVGVPGAGGGGGYPDLGGGSGTRLGGRGCHGAIIVRY